MSRRPGHSLLELVTALVLAGLICAAMFGTLAGGERIARSHAGRVTRAEAVRVSAAVLASELRMLEPSADLRALAGDSLVLRAFRGFAVVCAPAGPGGAVIVRYRGIRDSEPAKDSVLILDAGSAARSAKLEASAAVDGGCDARAGEALLRWTLTDPPRPGTLALLFESGSYQLDGALRYRRGSGGRQPITSELFDTRSSALRQLDPAASGAAGGPTAAEVVLAIAARAAPSPAAGSVPGGPVAAFRMRIAFLNRRRAMAGAGNQ